LVHGFSYITFIFHETPFSYTFQAFCPVLRSFPVLCLVIIAVGLLVPIIGALQLKQDDRLKDETFLSLMKLAITGLPFIGKRLEKSLNPADKSKDQE
jgi:cytochrome bd-type quinol oxidase subunit 2